MTLYSTLFEILIFCPKIQLWFISRQNCPFFWWKTREKFVVLDFLALDNFDFTRKIVKKIWMKNLWKCWGFVEIEFLDKNLTFRKVCVSSALRASVTILATFNQWRTQWTLLFLTGKKKCSIKGMAALTTLWWGFLCFLLLQDFWQHF